MATISLTLQRIKQDIQPFLPDHLIHAVCQQLGYRWRERLLDPVATIHLFILQILWFNTPNDSPAASGQDKSKGSHIE